MGRQTTLEERMKAVIDGNKDAREAYLAWLDDEDHEAYGTTLVPIIMQATMTRTHGPTILDVHEGLNTMRDNGWKPSAP